MSDTPRTDAEEYAGTIDGDVGFDYVPSVFARQLERELSDALAERDAARECLRELRRNPNIRHEIESQLGEEIWQRAGMEGENALKSACSSIYAAQKESCWSQRD